jgi:hypothetical protein
MPTQIITTISGRFPDIVVIPKGQTCVNIFFIFAGIFYLLGESISQRRLHCSPFALVHDSFMGRFFVAAAILTR